MYWTQGISGVIMTKTRNLLRSKLSSGNCFGRRNSMVMVGYDATLKPILFETEIKKVFALALQIRNI